MQTYNGKELEDSITKFFFNKIYNKMIIEWKKDILELSEDNLLELKSEFVNNINSLPSKLEIPLYNTDPEYFPGGASFPTLIPKGNQTIIEVSYNYCNEIIELIDQRIEELNKNKLKEFPKFGVWNSLEDPKYFKLKKDILRFVALVFEKVKVDRGIQYSELYYSLINILYKYNDNQYSFSGIRKAKKVAFENKNKSKRKVYFTQKESYEFINFLLDVESNKIVLKKQSHS